MSEIQQSNDFERLEIIELVRILCNRPKTFFRNGSFEAGAMFIEGFAQGRGGKSQLELSQFNKWLAKRLSKSHGAARNLTWWSYIELLSSDDANPFAVLLSVFETFVSEQG